MGLKKIEEIAQPVFQAPQPDSPLKPFDILHNDWCLIENPDGEVVPLFRKVQDDALIGVYAAIATSKLKEKAPEFLKKLPEATVEKAEKIRAFFHRSEALQANTVLLDVSKSDLQTLPAELRLLKNLQELAISADQSISLSNEIEEMQHAFPDLKVRIVQEEGACRQAPKAPPLSLEPELDEDGCFIS